MFKNTKCSKKSKQLTRSSFKVFVSLAASKLCGVSSNPVHFNNSHRRSIHDCPLVFVEEQQLSALPSLDWSLCMLPGISEAQATCFTENKNSLTVDLCYFFKIQKSHKNPILHYGFTGAKERTQKQLCSTKYSIFRTLLEHEAHKT